MPATRRRRTLDVVALALSAALAIPALCRAEESQGRELPSVRAVMDAYVAAIGGREVIFRHKSMTITGEFLPSEKGSALGRKVYYGEGKMLYEITLPGGQYREGFDGRTAWSVHPRTGPALFHGDVVKSKQRDADMHYPARILDYFRSMEVVDVADFEGHTCYHLRGTNNWGQVNEQFYDTKSGLLIGYRFNSAWRGGPGEEREVFSDYKEFGGWLMPTRAEHKSADGAQVEITTAVTFDDVPDSVFDLPAEVRALVGKTPTEARSG